jgi:hypothetical protein
MTSTTLTPSRLWKRMTAEQRLQASLAFWLDDQAANDQVQAVLLIAQQKKFRAKTIIGFDDERKAKHLASLATVPDAIVGRALIAYHLTEARPMMGAFLDALGIAHEEGLIQEENVAPDPAKLAPAAKAIASQYPADQVSLYLNTLLCQDPDTWKGLEGLPELA